MWQWLLFKPFLSWGRCGLPHEVLREFVHQCLGCFGWCRCWCQFKAAAGSKQPWAWLGWGQLSPVTSVTCPFCPACLCSPTVTRQGCHSHCTAPGLVSQAVPLSQAVSQAVSQAELRGCSSAGSSAHPRMVLGGQGWLLPAQLTWPGKAAPATLPSCGGAKSGMSTGWDWGIWLFSLPGHSRELTRPGGCGGCTLLPGKCWWSPGTDGLSWSRHQTVCGSESIPVSDQRCTNPTAECGSE